MQNGDMEKLRNYAMVAGVRTGGEKLNSINVASIIEGSHYPNEYIVITAHLDHVGIEGEDIFNGADDDGSGSMALLEIAQAFKMASLDIDQKDQLLFFMFLLKKKVYLVQNIIRIILFIHLRIQSLI